MVRREPVPSGVQVAADAPGAALPRLRRRGARARARAGTRAAVVSRAERGRAREIVALFLELAALPSPPGEEREVADAVVRYLRELGLEPDEDDAGARSARRWATSTRASSRRRTGRRSSSARISTRCRRAASSRRCRGRRRAERRRHDPRRRQQGGGRRDARGRAARARRESAARGDRAPVHAEGGGRPPRRGGVRPRGCTRSSATSTTRQRRSARSSSARRGRRRWRSRFHGRAAHSGMFPEEGRSAIAGRGEGDRRPAARPRRRGDDGERRPHLRRHRRRTSSRSGARSRRRRAATTSGSSASSCRRCSTRARSPRPRPSARSRRRCGRTTAATASSATMTSCGSPRGADAVRPRADLRALRRRSGRERLQRARPALRQPRERDDDIHTPDERIAVADLDAMVDVTLALVDVARAA